MDETKINQTADLLKVIANPARLKILLLLTSQGPRNVSSIQDYFQLDQAAVSHHLTKLKDKGILVCQRKGKEIHYRTNSSSLQTLTDLLLPQLNKGAVLA